MYDLKFWHQCYSAYMLLKQGGETLLQVMLYTRRLAQKKQTCEMDQGPKFFFLQEAQSRVILIFYSIISYISRFMMLAVSS